MYIEQKDRNFLEGLAAQPDMKAAAKKLITRLKKRLPEQLATDSDSLTNNIWKTIFVFCDQLTYCFERQQVNGTAFWQHFEPMLERLLPEGVYNALAKHIVRCELARSYNNLLRLDTCSKEETIHHTIELMDQAFDFAYSLRRMWDIKKHVFYYSASDFDCYAEELAQNIFAETFLQLYLPLYDDAASKTRIQEYICYLSKYQSPYSFKLLAVVRFLSMLSEGTRSVYLDGELLYELPEYSYREITLPESVEEVSLNLFLFDVYGNCAPNIDVIRLGSHIKKFALNDRGDSLSPRRLVFAARPQLDDEQWDTFKSRLFARSQLDYDVARKLSPECVSLDFLSASFAELPFQTIEVYFGQDKVWPNADTAKEILEWAEMRERERLALSSKSQMEETDLPF